MRPKHNLRKINEDFFITNPTELGYDHPNPLIRFCERRRKKLIVKEVDQLKGNSILDVGCEAGRILLSLNTTGQERLVGLDIANNALKKAKNRAMGNFYDYILADARALPVKQSAFDIAICSHILEHVPDSERIVEELRNILKPDGSAVVNVPNEQFTLKIKSLIKKLKLRALLGKLSEGSAPGHIRVFTLQSFKKLLSG